MVSRVTVKRMVEKQTNPVNTATSVKLNNEASESQTRKEFASYIEAQESQIFDDVNNLYKKTRAELKNEKIPHELKEPTVCIACDDYANGAIASYDSLQNKITFYKRGYKIFLEIKNAEANGDAFMAEKLKYYLNHIVGHELGHELTVTAFFSMSPDYDYASGASRRKSDGLSELVGFYIAQKYVGNSTDNNSIADAMLNAVIENATELKEFNENLLMQWQSMSVKEKLAQIPNIDVHTSHSIYYDYAIIGFAQVLKSNPETDLVYVVKTAILAPEKLPGLNEYISAISGSAVELELRDMQKRVVPDPTLKDVTQIIQRRYEEIVLQSSLSAWMLQRAEELLGRGRNTLRH